MADNFPLTPGSGRNAATDQVTYSGDTADVQIFRPVDVTGSEGSKTVKTWPRVVSAFHFVTTANTNAQNVKASAGTLRGLYIFNSANYAIYVKIHNSSGTPTAGSGVVRTFGVQGGREILINLPGGGLELSTGIAITIVKGLADADATPIAAEDAVGEIFYE